MMLDGVLIGYLFFVVCGQDCNPQIFLSSVNPNKDSKYCCDMMTKALLRLLRAQLRRVSYKYDCVMLELLTLS